MQSILPFTTTAHGAVFTASLDMRRKGIYVSAEPSVVTEGPFYGEPSIIGREAAPKILKALAKQVKSGFSSKPPEVAEELEERHTGGIEVRGRGTRFPVWRVFVEPPSSAGLNPNDSDYQALFEDVTKKLQQAITGYGRETPKAAQSSSDNKDGGFSRNRGGNNDLGDILEKGPKKPGQ